MVGRYSQNGIAKSLHSSGVSRCRDAPHGAAPLVLQGVAASAGVVMGVAFAILQVSQKPPNNRVRRRSAGCNRARFGAFRSV